MKCEKERRPLAEALCSQHHGCANDRLAAGTDATNHKPAATLRLPDNENTKRKGPQAQTAGAHRRICRTAGLGEVSQNWVMDAAIRVFHSKRGTTDPQHQCRVRWPTARSPSRRPPPTRESSGGGRRSYAARRSPFAGGTADHLRGSRLPKRHHARTVCHPASHSKLLLGTHAVGAPSQTVVPTPRRGAPVFTRSESKQNFPDPRGVRLWVVQQPRRR